MSNFNVNLNGSKLVAELDNEIGPKSELGNSLGHKSESGKRVYDLNLNVAITIGFKSEFGKSHGTII